MPTGYTAAIADGISFKEYALNCARAFGACVSMRDDPADTPIPEEFKPSTYHQDALKKAKARLAKLRKMTRKQCETASKREYANAIKREEESIRKNADLKSKYETMLEEARAYVPPSKDHVEFKEFMCSQIVSSIDFDCGSEYYQNSLETLKSQGPLSADEWKKKEIESTVSDIECHTREQGKENARCAARTKWVNQLRQSL